MHLRLNAASLTQMYHVALKIGDDEDAAFQQALRCDLCTFIQRNPDAWRDHFLPDLLLFLLLLLLIPHAALYLAQNSREE
jgi:hypothetical protein